MEYISGLLEGLAEITPTTMSILASIVIVVVILLILGPRARFGTKVIVYGGLCIAIAFILSYIRIYRWPQGGSITLASMLPMFIFAHMFGPAAGISAGAAYGLLQLIQDPYILHPMQVILDYVIAFGAMGLAGCFPRNFSLGVLIGGLGRYFSSFLSGVIFFAAFAPENMNPMVYSLLVNGLTIGTDTLICLLISFMPQVRSLVMRLQDKVI